MNKIGIAAIGLASLAIVMSAIALGRERVTPPPDAVSAIRSPISADSAPLGSCDGKQSVETFEELMKERVGGDLTRISYALHHDARASAERMDDVAAHAGHLLGCIRQIPVLRPNVDLDRMSEFYKMIDDMQSNALALQVAALERDESTARHWFTHLKQDCVACHSRFRTQAVQ